VPVPVPVSVPVPVPAPFFQDVPPYLLRVFQAMMYHLELSPTNRSGFLGVSSCGSDTRFFQAVLEGKPLGVFHTEVEAAQAYAQAKRGEAVTIPSYVRPEPTRDAEGFWVADNKTGFLGVWPIDSRFFAVYQNERTGPYSTAREAAQAYAQAKRGEAVTVPKRAPVGTTAAKNAKGLYESDNLPTGFLGVTLIRGWFYARYDRKYLGQFDNAEEAAEVYAKVKDAKDAKVAAKAAKAVESRAQARAAKAARDVEGMSNKKRKVETELECEPQKKR